MLIAASLALVVGWPQEAGAPCERHTDRDIVQTWLPAPERGRREASPKLVVMTDLRCSTCRAPLPEGAVMTITGTPQGYRVLLRNDRLTWGTAEGVNIATVNEPLREAGRLDYEGSVDTPGLYLVHTNLDPNRQDDLRAFRRLKSYFNAPRDANEIEFLNFQDHPVLAGNPSLLLEAERRPLQEFWRKIRRALDALNQIEELGRSGRGDDLEAKAELIDQLLGVERQAVRERQRTLLTGSYGLLVVLLQDVQMAADYIQKLLEYEAATGGPTDQAAEADDNWQGSGVANATHLDPPPEYMPTVDAGSYGGVLNLANLKAALELAPVFGLRELLLWYLRVSRLGADEVGGTLAAWVAATEPGAREASGRLAEQHLAVWTPMAEAVDDRTFEELGSATAGASRRFRQRGWDTHLGEFQRAYWPLVRRYFATAREVLSDASRTELPEDFVDLEAQLRSESERMHGEIARSPWGR